MSDFTFEQLKSLFDNMQDRLDKTQGDKLSFDQLEKIRAILEKTRSVIDKAGRPGAVPLDTTRVINDFVGKVNKAQSRTRTKPADQSGGSFIDRKLNQQKIDSETKFQKIRNESNRGMISGLRGFKSGIDRASNSVSGFMDNLKRGGMLAAAGGGTGTALGKAGAKVKDRVDAYREMIASGEGQFTSIQQMANSANDAHMTVQELAKAMKESQGARLVGGQGFARMTGELTRTTNGIANMGLNFEQRQEAMQDYLDLARSQGSLRSLSESQMVQGIQNMVKSSEETAHILGMTRKEALDARKEQAQDPLLQTIIRGLNLNQTAQAGVEDAAVFFKKNFGEIGERLFKQSVAGISPTGESAKLASTDPELYRLVQSAANVARSGGEIDRAGLSAASQRYAQNNDRSGLNTTKAQIALNGNTDLTGVLTASLGGQLSSLGNNTNKPVDKLTNAGTRAELKAEETIRAAATVLEEAFDTVHNSILNVYGPTMEQLNTDIQNASEAARVWTRSLQGSPEAVANLGLGAAGLMVAFTALGTAVGFASKAMGIFRSFGGAGAAVGGGTYISRMLGRGAGGAGGAGGAAAGVGLGSKMVKGSALVGAGVESLGYMFGDKELSMKNLAKSGLRVGGGLAGTMAGGAFGSLLGPLGTIAGGVGGGAAGASAGDWLADMLLGADDLKSTSGPARGQQSPNGRTGTPDARNTSRADATARRGSQDLNIDDMTRRIMVAQEQSLTYLRGIRDSNDQQVQLMRDEINLTRIQGERISRLLEEGNRNTRTIADHSA